ncbi:MAG: hypothetical protein RIR97_1835, partial [Pseudomonadota bacterium]
MSGHVFSFQFYKADRKYTFYQNVVEAVRIKSAAGQSLFWRGLILSASDMRRCNDWQGLLSAVQVTGLCHPQLETHMTGVIHAYKYGRRLKNLKGLTSPEYIPKLWTKELEIFRRNLCHEIPEPNRYVCFVTHVSGSDINNWCRLQDSNLRPH